MKDNIKQYIFKVLLILFLINLSVALLTTFMKLNMDDGFEFTSSVALVHSFSYIAVIGLGLALVFGYLHITFAILAIICMLFSMGVWYKFSYVKEYSEGQYIVREIQGLGEKVLIFYTKENAYTLKWSHKKILDY
ncbi:MAG: hypothetical protein ACRDD7_07885 [Peptostreptococcaceae bacterium]